MNFLSKKWCSFFSCSLFIFQTFFYFLAKAEEPAFDIRQMVGILREDLTLPQGTCIIKVIRKSLKEPVQNKNVELVALGKENTFFSSTDLEGRAQFHELPPGFYIASVKEQDKMIALSDPIQIKANTGSRLLLQVEETPSEQFKRQSEWLAALGKISLTFSIPQGVNTSIFSIGLYLHIANHPILLATSTYHEKKSFSFGHLPPTKPGDFYQVISENPALYIDCGEIIVSPNSYEQKTCIGYLTETDLSSLSIGAQHSNKPSLISITPSENFVSIAEEFTIVNTSNKPIIPASGMTWNFPSSAFETAVSSEQSSGIWRQKSTEQAVLNAIFMPNKPLNIKIVFKLPWNKNQISFKQNFPISIEETHIILPKEETLSATLLESSGTISLKTMKEEQKTWHIIRPFWEKNPRSFHLFIHSYDPIWDTHWILWIILSAPLLLCFLLLFSARFSRSRRKYLAQKKRLEDEKNRIIQKCFSLETLSENEKEQLTKDLANLYEQIDRLETFH